MPMVSSLVINVLNINLVLSYFGYVLEPIENYQTNDEEESRSAKKKIKPSEDYSFNDDCEFFSDDSLLSYVKSSTFTNTSAGECKKFITPTESFERTLENDDFNDEELSFESREGDAVFVSSVAVLQKQYSIVNGSTDEDNRNGNEDENDNEEEKFHDTISNSGSNNSVEVGMEIAEDEIANKSQDFDKGENDLSNGIIEHNEEDVDQVKTISSNSASATNVSNIRNMPKGYKSTRGKGKRKGKKK